MKKRFISGMILLLLIFSFHPGNAQKEGLAFIDSLKAELPKLANDTNKVRMLAELSYRSYSYNLEEGVRTGKKALKLAQDLNYISGIAISRLSLSYCYFYQSNIPLVIDNLLEAEPIFRNSGDVDRLCATYIVLAAANGRFDSTKRVEYYFKAKSLWWKTKSDRLRFSTLSWIADMSSAVEPDSSDKYFSLLIKIAENHNTPEYLARKYSILAYIYEKEKNFDSAFYYRNLALPLLLQLEDKENLAVW